MKSSLCFSHLLEFNFAPEVGGIDVTTSGQLLLSPLFLSVLRFEHQGLAGDGGGQGGDSGRGQGQQEGGARPQHTDGLNLCQPPRPKVSGGGVASVGVAMGLGVEGRVLRGRGELQQRLRASDLQGRGAGGREAGGGPRMRLRHPGRGQRAQRGQRLL